jgi:hypothetical protein
METTAERDENLMHQVRENGNCIPVVTGLHAPYGLEELTRLCEEYHGLKGRFAYFAFAWANEHVYGGRLQLPLIQWALTPYGKCIGMTEYGLDEADLPVITLHPLIWRKGPRYTLDTVVHESMHLWCKYIRGGWVGKSSHDNPIWAEEVSRVSPRLGLPSLKAAPTKRKRENGKMLRVVPDDCIAMEDLASWPHSMRPAGYYREKTVPFNYGVTSSE